MSECRARYENLIKKKAERDRLAQMTEEEKARKRFEDSVRKIETFGDRINDILYLANKCVANGINIPNGEKYGYGASFVAEGFYHHVGLAGKNGSYHGSYKSIMIRNGGYCGDIDLIVTEEDVSGIYNGGSNQGKFTQPRTRDMEKFIKEFPNFEEAFYKWLDSLEEG